MHYSWCSASKRSTAVLKETCVQPSTVCFILRRKVTHKMRKIVGICMQAIPKVEISAWTKREELPTCSKFKQPLLIVSDAELFMSWFKVYIWAMKSSATELCLSLTGSFVESERSFRYDKSALLPISFQWNIYLKENREISKLTAHTVIQVDMYPIGVLSVEDWKVLDLYLERWLRYGWVGFNS